MVGQKDVAEAYYGRVADGVEWAFDWRRKHGWWRWIVVSEVSGCKEIVQRPRTTASCKPSDA